MFEHFGVLVALLGLLLPFLALFIPVKSKEPTAEHYQRAAAAYKEREKANMRAAKAERQGEVRRKPSDEGCIPTFCFLALIAIGASNG